MALIDYSEWLQIHMQCEKCNVLTQPVSFALNKNGTGFLLRSICPMCNAKCQRVFSITEFLEMGTDEDYVTSPVATTTQ
jgi:hypothetical protein